ncbi:MAG: beta/gamma crystallin-related protein [Ramlibacter sp.]|nr:beta/gamma crystallin-related protein [Ramlibacter sp.]
MKRTLQYAMAIGALTLAGHAAAQITFYEGREFRGRAFTASNEVQNFDRTGMNDKISSIVVDRGRWEVCEDSRFRGRCVVLRRGNYPSLQEFDMNNRISSVRPIQGGRRYQNEIAEPVAVAPVYEYRRRANERVTEVPVTSVRAVVGPPNQRCWVERQAVAEPSRGEPNVGGALAGALIGGILGHQVGGGSGKDAATAAGVIGGAAIGANQGRGPGGTTIVERDVQRCQTNTSDRVEYYDVTYNYRGAEHRVQMATPPGRTIIVNERGEPRQ